MNSSEVYRRVVGVVCRVLNVDGSLVEPESHFVFDLGAESTQSIQLVAGFEAEFGIEIDAEAALGVQTVGAAVDFIAQQLKDKG
ncbi:MAG: acyl carrier protein [Thermoguttaceae bacterium]